MKTTRIATMAAAATFAIASCGGAATDEAVQSVEATTETSGAEATPRPTSPSPTTPPEEPAPATEGDQEGESTGTLILAEPVEWSEEGLSLVVDAVRIVGVEELGDEANEDLTVLLDDDQAQTFIGLRVTLTNATDESADWFVGGFDTAVVIGGQQAGPFFLGDSGDTVRANAELEVQPYYESRLTPDEAKAAGSFTWDPGSPVDPETFATIAEIPELTITYEYP